MKRIDYILDFCKELGKQMIVAGANIERVDLCIEHLCHAYGLHDVTCANLTTRISISAKDEEKNYAHRQTDVPPQSLNLERLKELNHLYYKVKDELPDVTTLYDLLHGVTSNDFSWWVILIGYLVAMAALARIFAAGPFELLAIEANTLILFGLSKLSAKIHLNKIVTNFISMFICSALAMLLFKMQAIGNIYVVIITNAFFLVPGIQMVNCARNLLCGNEMNGIIDLIKVVLEVCTIVAGVAAAYALLANFIGNPLIEDYVNPNPAAPDLIHIFELIFMTLLASLGFGIVFNIQLKDLAFAGIGGVIVRVVYVLLQLAIPQYRFVLITVAAFFASLYATILGIRKREPSTLYLYPSVVPLIPGDLFLYFGLGLIWNNGYVNTYGPDLALSLIGISVGFVICSTVVHYVKKAKFFKILMNTNKE